jgi:hypothetical protein
VRGVVRGWRACDETHMFVVAHEAFVVCLCACASLRCLLAFVLHVPSPLLGRCVVEAWVRFSPEARRQEACRRCSAVRPELMVRI